MKSLTAEYRTWCGQTGSAPIGLSDLLDEVEKVCSKLGIEIEVGDDRRVYCMNVRLGTQGAKLRSMAKLSSSLCAAEIS